MSKYVARFPICTILYNIYVSVLLIYSYYSATIYMLKRKNTILQVYYGIYYIQRKVLSWQIIRV